MDRLLEYLNRHPFLASLAVAMALAVIAFEMRQRKLGHAAVPAQEAIQLMNQGAQLYDLRSSEDFSAGRINGARNLDPDQQGKAAEVLKRFKDRLLLLYCENGTRSAALTRQLQADGFTKVFSLRGGLAAWRADGLPLAK